MVKDILKVDNLAVRFSKQVVLEHISFTVKEQEMVGLVGASGVGKTSLLNGIISYTPLWKGKVSFYSPKLKRMVEYGSEAKHLRQLYGVAAQRPSFYPELSAMENLEYFASLYKLPENIKNQNIKKAIELVQLKEHEHKPAKNLSGGMQKRLDIACAIVHNPPILFLDEPTADVDPLLRHQIWQVLENINDNGTTIVVASHFLSEVEAMCDEMVFLHDKKMAFFGKPEDFRKRHASLKEVHLSIDPRDVDGFLQKVGRVSFLEVKEFFKKKGLVILHSKEGERTIRSTISRLLPKKQGKDVHVCAPSMDMLFKVIARK